MNGRYWITSEKEAEKVKFEGRTVYWMQTPERTGGHYSSVCTCIYEPTARAKPAHSHEWGEETVYVLSGSGKVKIGDRIADIETGSLLFFPQGVAHMVWNSGIEPLHLLCFYAPDRKATQYTYHETFDFPEFQPGGSQK